MRIFIQGSALKISANGECINDTLFKIDKDIEDAAKKHKTIAIMNLKQSRRLSNIINIRCKRLLLTTE